LELVAHFDSPFEGGDENKVLATPMLSWRS
jgi:hypothetical protein